VVNVAVGKFEIGTAVMLFARQTHPGVVLARGVFKHLSKVGFVARGGVGVDERQHAGWRWVYQLAEFSPLPGIRVPRRDTSHIPRVQERVQLVGASSQHTAIANDRGFIRRAAVNPHRAVVGEQQTKLEVCRGYVMLGVAYRPGWRTAFPTVRCYLPGRGWRQGLVVVVHIKVPAELKLAKVVSARDVLRL